MDKASIRKLRLKSEYEEMQSIQNTQFLSWEAVKGEPPYVEEYLLNVRLRTYCAPEKTIDEFKVKITLPKDYPFSPPMFKQVSEPLIFNPGWFPSGVYGSFCYDVSCGLVSFIKIILYTTQYSEEYIYTNSPCNWKALKWYLDNKDNKDLFPSDSISFSEGKYKKTADELKNKDYPKSVLVTFLNDYYGVEIEAEVPVDMTANEIIENLKQEMFFLTEGVDYGLFHEIGEVSGEATLEDAGVKDGDVIRVR